MAQEHLLLLQRTYVWLPALTLWLTLFVTPVPRDLTPFSSGTHEVKSHKHEFKSSFLEKGQGMITSEAKEKQEFI